MKDRDKSKRLDNTIKIVADVLEKHKDEIDIKEAYEDIKNLKNKRKIK